MLSILHCFEIDQCLTFFSHVALRLFFKFILFILLYHCYRLFWHGLLLQAKLVIWFDINISRWSFGGTTHDMAGCQLYRSALLGEECSMPSYPIGWPEPGWYLVGMGKVFQLGRCWAGLRLAWPFNFKNHYFQGINMEFCLLKLLFFFQLPQFYFNFVLFFYQIHSQTFF